MGRAVLLPRADDGKAMNTRSEFDRAWPWLEAAVLDYGPVETKETVWARIEGEYAQLWTTENAALVTSIEVSPSGFRELRGWLAGGDLAEIQKIEPALAQWGRQMNCRRAVIQGRRGWLKAFSGYKERAVIMTKEL